MAAVSLPFLRSGVQLLSDFCANGRMLTTGIAELDKLIGGGLCTGQVMEIIGPSTSGKTHICHAMTAHVAASHPPALGHRVLYIDCSGQFSVARLLSFVENECRCEKEAGDREEFHVAQTMRRVSVSRCLDLQELVCGFEKMLAQVKLRQKSTAKCLDSSGSTVVASNVSVAAETRPVLPELIVIDSLTSAFALLPLGISDEGKKDNKEKDTSWQQNRAVLERLMAQFSLLIRQVANLANLAVVVTNPIPVPQLLFSGSYYNAWSSAPHIRIAFDLTPPSVATKFYGSSTKSGATSSDSNSLSRIRRFAVLRHHSGFHNTDEAGNDRQPSFWIDFNLP